MDALMRRRSRWTAHTTVRAVLSVAIAMALVVSPWMPAEVPEPAARLGIAPASAQTPPVDCPSDPLDPLFITESTCKGLADDCPSDPADVTRPWEIDMNDPSLCVLSEPACPESPLQVPDEPVRYTLPATDFPDFCHDTVLDSEWPSTYADCAYIQPDNDSPAEVLTGFTRKLDTVDGDPSCRAIVPASCADGLHQVSSNECRQYERRTWECPANAILGNRFNTCHQPPPDYVGNHPACQTGAPQFSIADCAAYVGLDFARTPATVDCTAYDTGAIASQLTVHTNDYWCTYNPSWLDVDCYGSAPPCLVLGAMCIKRASRTGGCDAIANTIRCRSLQARFLASNVSAEDVYQEQCAPCTILPFSPVPAECPARNTADPETPRSSIEFLRRTHEVRDDFDWSAAVCLPVRSDGNLADHPACANARACADPPRGRIEWDTAHASGVAIVNSPIFISVVDVPVDTETIRVFALAGGRIFPSNRPLYTYAGSIPNTPGSTVRQWPEMDPTHKSGDVSEMMEGGECIMESLPAFRLIAEELWPDNDADEMQSLFGPRALDWWNSMALDDQRALSEARGFVLLTGLTTTEQTRELERREAALRQEADCNYGTEVWCRWAPRRAGYFRLTAVGAWHTKKFTASREWRDPNRRNSITNFLQNDVSEPDGVCNTDDRFARGRDHDCLLEELTLMGLSSPADVGLLDDLSDLLPTNGNNEFLFTAAAGNTFGCPPHDLRVTCSGGADSVNYTTTNSVGIAVHEARVVTHQASAAGP